MLLVGLCILGLVVSMVCLVLIFSHRERSGGMLLAEIVGAFLFTTCSLWLLSLLVSRPLILIILGVGVFSVRVYFAKHLGRGFAGSLCGILLAALAFIPTFSIFETALSFPSRRQTDAELLTDSLQWMLSKPSIAFYASLLSVVVLGAILGRVVSVRGPD
jgi:hypothetical protein